uniref:Uncharacterized protein n=1 Tax=Glossina austeni TaxID=7395 RepID=A0A1A9VVX3_GLOAU
MVMIKHFAAFTANSAVELECKNQHHKILLKYPLKSARLLKNPLKSAKVVTTLVLLSITGFGEGSLVGNFGYRFSFTGVCILSYTCFDTRSGETSELSGSLTVVVVETMRSETAIVCRVGLLLSALAELAELSSLTIFDDAISAGVETCIVRRLTSLPVE